MILNFVSSSILDFSTKGIFFIFLIILVISLIGLLAVRFFFKFYFYYQFLKNHLNNPKHGILFFDANGKLTFYSKNASSIFDLDFKDKKGVLFQDIFKNLPQMRLYLENLILNKRKIQSEFSHFQQARMIKGYLFGYPITILNKPMGFVLEILDMSNEILREREDLIHRLIRKIAHDIKTPLATIKFSLETLKFVVPVTQDGELEEGLKNINHEISRIQAITNNYSKIANINRLRVNVVDLKKLCFEVISQFHPPEMVKISVKTVPEAQLITADEDQLRVMFKELIENSLDAVAPKGEISIATFPASFSNQFKKDAVCISIKDNGAGIAAGIKDKIFDPSFTTKTHGTGLGLVFVKQIVDNHQGQILITSEPNKGTKVQIILPKTL